MIGLKRIQILLQPVFQKHKIDLETNAQTQAHVENRSL